MYLNVRVTVTVVFQCWVFILTLDLLIFLEMTEPAIFFFRSICLLLPSEGAANGDKKVSTSTKVRFLRNRDQVLIFS